MAESDDETPTPREMGTWLRNEVWGLTKMLELRLKDATDLVTIYGSGRISAQDASKRLSKIFRPMGGLTNARVGTDARRNDRPRNPWHHR